MSHHIANDDVDDECHGGGGCFVDFKSSMLTPYIRMMRPFFFLKKINILMIMSRNPDLKKKIKII